MGCIANPQKFLFLIPYNGPHDYKAKYIQRDMLDSYVVKYECTKCGVRYTDYFATEEKLVEEGYDVHKLHKLSSWDLFSTDAEELRKTS